MKGLNWVGGPHDCLLTLNQVGNLRPSQSPMSPFTPTTEGTFLLTPLFSATPAPQDMELTYDAALMRGRVRVPRRRHRRKRGWPG